MTSQLELPCTNQFISAVRAAIAKAKESDDPAVRYAAAAVPIYAQPKATEAQALACGCKDCLYLGLWANAWSGYQSSEHGIIWLFEEGIRQTMDRTGLDMETQCLSVLLHEIDHALQRDHVLEALQQQQEGRGQTYARP
jgi:hypothetical protein